MLFHHFKDLICGKIRKKCTSKPIWRSFVFCFAPLQICPIPPNLQFGSHKYQHFQCETLARFRFPCLIQQPKQPQWDFVPEADFNLVRCYITVGQVADLAETFALAAHLEKELTVN